ncbi:MAG TPA: ABC transporter ATP-binding protein, partial [Polyangiales bacterium]|nr:ABC transporter ATP-binding protein [Polyangiales bacterium]
MNALLKVDQLAVRFGTAAAPVLAIDDVSFEVSPGETVCLVGESGSGKTLTALSVLRLEQQQRATLIGGGVHFEGADLSTMREAKLEHLRGKRIGMVFQEPMTAFDPVFTIGEQIVETMVRHLPLSRKQAYARAEALLARVHIPDPALRMRQIPDQLSGGMRQRAMIAMALACDPALLIADEPTTALDVTIQAQILALLKELQRESGMGILLITHDLGVAAQMADRVVVMYAGRVVEQGAARQIFKAPKHPYTRGLLGSAVLPDSERGTQLAAISGSVPRLDSLPSGCSFHPRCDYASERCRTDEPQLVDGLACFHPDEPVREKARVKLRVVPAEDRALVEVRGLSKWFEHRQGLFTKASRVHALDDVSLSIRAGETFGLVGESGCGKSTLGRALLMLDPAQRGEVTFEGERVTDSPATRRNMQMIFQDPYGSLDPRWTVGRLIAEPLVAQRVGDVRSREARVLELLELVGLPGSSADRYPHEFSGGQRQRIGIARALAVEPKFVVADEALSALDLSVQAQIINLWTELRARLGLTALFIGHGLHVVRHLSDRIGVMYLGRVVEVAPADELFASPAHPYTRVLLDAI